jgi:hypothetical protein
VGTGQRARGAHPLRSLELCHDDCGGPGRAAGGLGLLGPDPEGLGSGQRQLSRYLYLRPLGTMLRIPMPFTWSSPSTPAATSTCRAALNSENHDCWGFSGT